MALTPIAAVAGLILVAGAGTAQASPLGARAAFQPASVLFGDPVRATVTVVLERGTVDAGAVHVEPSFAPYSPTGSPTVTRSASGSSETLRYAYELMCVDDGCLPGKKPLVLKFPPVVVTSKRLTVRARLPDLEVSSRLAPGATTSAGPKFRIPTGVPAVQYAVSPGSLSGLLIAATALLGAAGVLLLVREGVRLGGHRRLQALARRTPLEIALAYARQAARRPPVDRRKALGFLAEALDRRGDDALAAKADAAAWKEEPPEAERVLALADEVEIAAREGGA